jgi:hypothetical protein
MFRKTDELNAVTVKKFFPVTPTGVLALENFFQEMSEKGYLPTGVQGIFYEFTIAEPAKRRFQVDYFSKASIFDSGPEMKTQEYIEYCKSAGWIHCFGNGKMQCFYTEDLNAPDIDTEDVLRFQSIAKAEFWNNFPQWVLALLYGYLGADIISDTASHYSSWARFTSTPISLGFFLFFALYLIGAVSGFMRFMMFYIRNRRKLARGESLELTSVLKVKKSIRIRIIGLSLLFIPLIYIATRSASQIGVSVTTLLTISVIIFTAGWFMKSRYSNRKTNVILLVVLLYLGILATNVAIMAGADSEGTKRQVESSAVTLEEMGFGTAEDDAVHEEYSHDKNRSFMAASRTHSAVRYHESEYAKNIEKKNVYPFYTMRVFESDYNWIVNRYRTLVFEKNELISGSRFPYPELIRQGYEGYLVRDTTDEEETTRLMLVRENRFILIISHELLSEENILLLLRNI